MNQNKMLELINHLKNAGFVFQGSEIYGGVANTWDYGPLGVLLKDNILNYWKKFFVFSQNNIYMLDSKILLNSKVWEASGHVGNFNDPLIENKINNKRYRADKVIEELFPNENVAKMTHEQMQEFLQKNVTSYDNSKCAWSEIKKFNLMFETFQGVVDDKKKAIYLRPETAQGIFINFKNIQRAMRAKLPFGVAQVGKSFRNEVTPGNFIFRTREFEQMELEFFFDEETPNSYFDELVNKSYDFMLKLGLSKNNLKVRKHDQEELAHYSKATVDLEYNFPFGWGELMGIAHRGNFDLSTHSKFSNEKLEYLDPNTNKKLIPSVIEPSVGLDRLMLAILCEAYSEEKVSESDTRLVLKLDKKLSPYKVAILPLIKKFNPKANEIYSYLIDKNISVTFDESASIGKRYRRQDAIGTYYCLTVDEQSLEDNTVTLRDRDSMQQERINFKDILKFL
ncbi:glycine--tRNA ligase [Mycoplasmopsis synoviae]|uniref:Glycine--tRNA ligase n=2 Tax=Mycoplasmopsis synoviae TaxID=2109 RepID=SYG_MYCS5|nr:glycine--tRNA ligase [Mycoplasmopsis synoviae]Q4A5V9.1 RecName: Full=Glycine--tRNA ligase; AltName: Full=Glycyl-tRNA synthetase; Short=GlyRS [Mycoplasmopsis synoviae 53]AAZ43862.1 glycyl-tRNA synthetase [Mycoplasmopsis synoviae 53]MBD5788944.1 glycyl-tRNA synthetase [Mycoplasmopsis synoviae GX11-T]QXV99266.1 glycine--tRNA ligase [Mycoplasmopsis synoviae]UBM43445.1 glycine--tRNA ligase [Mycoplasmopsis synoviae]UBX97416.1 glycine--tRNA ligase [Mycoplasmopsis synoviae]